METPYLNHTNVHEQFIAPMHPRKITYVTRAILLPLQYHKVLQTPNLIKPQLPSLCSSYVYSFPYLLNKRKATTRHLTHNPPRRWASLPILAFDTPSKSILRRGRQLKHIFSVVTEVPCPDLTPRNARTRLKPIFRSSSWQGPEQGPPLLLILPQFGLVSIRYLSVLGACKDSLGNRARGCVQQSAKLIHICSGPGSVTRTKGGSVEEGLWILVWWRGILLAVLASREDASTKETPRNR